jgi:UDP-glucuronate 4-epimerase
VTDRLLGDGWRVVGVDNFDDFYDPALKTANLDRHRTDPMFELHRIDLRHRGALLEIGRSFDVVVHLAGLAGVRPSAQRPHDYCDVNVTGTANVISLVEAHDIPHVVFASSSSIYGTNPDVPWRENALPSPISVYASTKLAGESLVRDAVRRLGIGAVTFRFFTVYGDRQRPDLAITAFAIRMLNGEPIRIFGDGSALRDFTHVDDIVQGVMAGVAHRGPGYDVFNLARGERVVLTDVVESLEETLDVEAEIEYGDKVVGDVPQTWGAIDKAAETLGYQPTTSLKDGLIRSVDWFHSVAQRSSAARAS